MNEIKTVTLDVHDYDTMKSKTEAFNKLIEIACCDDVKFYQEWNKQDIRKACKGGSVKVGEITGKWKGEIRFEGDNGQRSFGEFVKTMIEGMDEEQRKQLEQLKKIVEENGCGGNKCDCEKGKKGKIGKWIEIDVSVIAANEAIKCYPDGVDKIKAEKDAEARKKVLLALIGRYDGLMRDYNELLNRDKNENKNEDKSCIKNTTKGRYNNYKKSHELVEIGVKDFYRGKW